MRLVVRHCAWCQPLTGWRAWLARTRLVRWTSGCCPRCRWWVALVGRVTGRVAALEARVSALEEPARQGARVA